jgi:uncharacterized membrane protein YdjX (TVP38/TMEM64 family)
MSVRVIGLATVLAGILLLTWWCFGQDMETTWNITTLTESFAKAKSWAWLVGIILLVADLLLPIPGTIVMSALGAVYGFWLGGLLASLGSFLAGLAGYGLGRFLKEQTAKRWLGEADFERGRSLLVGRGALIIALSRSIPILPEVIACMAGLLRMPFRFFCLAVLCGALPMGFLFAWIGTLGRDSPIWAFVISFGMPALLWLIAVVWRGKINSDPTPKNQAIG